MMFILRIVDAVGDGQRGKIDGIRLIGLLGNTIPKNMSRNINENLHEEERTCPECWCHK